MQGCPFNLWRTSGDITSTYESMFVNVQSTLSYHKRDAPLSGPGTWACECFSQPSAHPLPLSRFSALSRSLEPRSPSRPVILTFFCCRSSLFLVSLAFLAFQTLTVRTLARFTCTHARPLILLSHVARVTAS